MERADNVRIALDHLTAAIQNDFYGDVSTDMLQSLGELYSAIGAYAMEMDSLKKENAILRKILVEKFG